MYIKYRIIISTLIIQLLLTAMGSLAIAQSHSKVDNFIFLYDLTSSMHEYYHSDLGKKADLAKEAMHNINKEIPRLDFESGLYVVTPFFKAYKAMSQYNVNDFRTAISQLPPPAKHIGPHTPLAEGLTKLKPILNELSGSTALILFSDGGENKGGSPAEVLKKLYNKFDICFHFVSYARKDFEKEFIERMYAVDNCSRIITGEAVQHDKARQDFVRKIFFRTIKDSDGDGVRDSLDLCPDTPSGVKVDKDGCPVDSDGDGVPDYLDKCPNTPKDLVVDESGCPVPKRITLDIKFDFDKAQIKPNYHDELRKIADFLKKRPGVDIALEGHTDNIGSREYNKDLSQRRATSVKEYLVNKLDISPDRISTIGYGETKPVASNETPSGRQKNRRVEGVFPKIFQKK